MNSDDVRVAIDAAETFEPSEESRRSGVRHPFRLTESVLLYSYYDEKAEEERTIEVCSRVEVHALTRSEDGQDWGRWLRVYDSDGNAHAWAMPMAMLAGDGTGYREQLLRLGLRPGADPKWKSRLTQYVSQTQPELRALCVSRTGWHKNSEGRRIFVLPNETLGKSEGEPTLYQSEYPEGAKFGESGSLEKWQRQVAAPCAGNSRLVFGVSCGFAAPLLDLAGEESGGFHLVGRSSTGKSTALDVAGSVWGGGGVRGYACQWRATDNGLESIASSHSDALLCLDELSQVDPRAAGAIAYMLANGAGKSRARRDGSARPPASWRILFLSNGEITISDKVREDGRRRATAGQQVRVVDVPADAGAGLGVFESLHGFTNGDAFARHLKAVSRLYYGTAAPAFLRSVLERPEKVAGDVSRFRAEFVDAVVDSLCPDGADSQVLRVAGRFGLVAAAGELAIRFGLVPWEENAANNAAAACLRAWFEERGTAGAREIEDGIGQVLAFLQRYGESRFDVWEGGAAPVPQRAGWRRRDETEAWEYYVIPAVFKEELCGGFHATSIAEALAERGLLVKDPGGKNSVRLTPPGHRRQRLYHLPSSALEDREAPQESGHPDTDTFGSQAPPEFRDARL